MREHRGGTERKEREKQKETIGGKTREKDEGKQRGTDTGNR